MCARLFSRGFHGRRQEPEEAGRFPPGQYLVTDFPVLSAGPTPHTPLDQWTFSLEGEVDSPKRWSWEEFRALPHETVTKDIHCVTHWSKLDTVWEGEPLEPQHGGPARLLIPHLYFWKSAKWVRGLRLLHEDEPGFWELRGYHKRGDPWKEQRYWGD